MIALFVFFSSLYVLVFLCLILANPLTAAKHGFGPRSGDQGQGQGQGHDWGQGEDGGQGGGQGEGQESILIAAAENKRSLAAQRARQVTPLTLPALLLLLYKPA